ncbi:3'(2'),5'-bisphosphate nucleotidase CysQ [Roseiarcaceae bacterium H3SJ34-1]|uniref:3'(2'),5'-bisphosphate nucleotidase CysQ n=1 Tax=Terripilifer ovatus TaxID=3032367 RepID=UPI003AB9480D|nr:3'(2'),5'-bisphosphate nucleotidase CysQ [Roseiarcaceae bacterium H3SJ34-1]
MPSSSNEAENRANWHDSRLIDAIAEIAVGAGAVIMAHYGEGRSATKSDGSPVTQADAQAEEFIHGRLSKLLSGVPVVAEEACAAKQVPNIADVFVLVDPLDGTKEFLKRNGEFTVNIAVIENHVPVAGVVYAPSPGRLWLAGARAEAADIAAGARLDAATGRRDIHTRKRPKEGLVAMASRSHMNAETERTLELFDIVERRQAGSSMKFCHIAEGLADIYVRHGTTMEWDTAAGHAVLAAAGGALTGVDGRPFLYGKRTEDFYNCGFIAVGDPAILTVLQQDAGKH